MTALDDILVPWEINGNAQQHANANAAKAELAALRADRADMLDLRDACLRWEEIHDQQIARIAELETAAAPPVHPESCATCRASAGG